MARSSVGNQQPLQPPGYHSTSITRYLQRASPYRKTVLLPSDSERNQTFLLLEQQGTVKKATRRELHTFGGASEMAIKGVSYLRIAQNTVKGSVSFVLGRAKLTPAHATTIPCLELCAAVLGVELSELIYDELEQKPDSVS